MKILHFRLSTLLVAGALFLAGLMLYTVTLAPSVVTLFDDSLEFQLVTYQLGIAHPTGYPLYTLLGKLFTFIPVGNVAYRVNWMSAVFGAATAALLYLFILQAITPAANRLDDDTKRPITSHLGASFGALLMAVGLVFWQQATIAEVYTLHAFFVVLLLLAATLIAPCDNGPQGIYLLAFLAGLSLTHHRTMILLFPALALHVLLTCNHFTLLKPKTLLLTILFGFLPLLLYLYLPLRGHIGSLDETYQNTWPGFWQQVTASGYGSSFLLDNPFGHQRDFLFYWTLLAGQVYTTVLGLIGLVYLFFIGRRSMLALTATAFVTFLTFNLFYNVTDIEVFFIPNFMVWVVWSGVGAAFLLQTAASLKSPAWRYLSVGVLAAIFVFMLIQLFQTGRSDISQRYNWQVHDYGIDMLQQPLDDKAAVVGILGEMTLLRYFQQTENMRPGVETVTADQETDRLAAVKDLLAAGKSVYLTRELPGAPERWSLSAVGPLIQVQPKAPIAPPETALNRPVTPEIVLQGYHVSWVPHTGQGRAPVRLTLYWQATAPIDAELKVSARLVAPSGDVQAVADAVPVHFAYPTSAWRSGETIADVYDLQLLPDTASGPYTPLIIWYDPAQNAAEVGRVELPPVTID